MKRDDTIGLICLAIGAILLSLGALMNALQLGRLEERVQNLEDMAVNVYEIPTNTDADTTEVVIPVETTSSDATITDATATDATVTDTTITDATAIDTTAIDTTINDITEGETTSEETIETLNGDMTTTQATVELNANGSTEIATIEHTIEDIPNPTTTEEPKVYNPPMSDYEFSLICQVVECETHGADRESKAHIVHVIRNRIARSEWGSSWQSVILEPYQFGRRGDVTQSTIDAVNYALSIEDTTYGSIAFHSGGWCATFFGYQYVFTDSVGHKFYR